jgi:predicted unusual protein kinase regulating ubiquinone biosynthesis (AarF/ABC1/UbiB family)
LNFVTFGVAANVIYKKSYTSYCESLLVNNEMVPQQSNILNEVTKDDSVIQSLKNSYKSLLETIQYTLKYLERLITYLLYGSPLIGLAPAAYCFGGIYPPIEDLAWNYLIWAVTRLGPCFIKMAQWASTRPDLFPNKLVQKMIKLQDDVKVNHSMETVENTLMKAFGPDWKNKIDLDPKPLGAGILYFIIII